MSKHMVFDVKLGESYCRKARKEADGKTADAQISMITHSSVVSRDSLFNCKVQGPEFGSDEGR